MKEIKSFLKKAVVSKEVKNFLLLKESEFTKRHQLYINYTNLFASSFYKEKVTEKQVKSLDIAGFLYYISIVMMDDLFDNNKKSSPKSHSLYQLNFI